MKKHIVIFSGYNQRAIIAFLRVIKLYAENEFSIIASSNQDMIFLTEYKNKVFYVRKNKELIVSEIIESLNLLKKSKHVSNLVVLPSTEALNRFVLHNRDIFLENGIEIPLVDIEKYELLSDKEKFWNLCKRNNIYVPKCICFPNRFVTPFVAKPKTYYGKDNKVRNPDLILSDYDYLKFLKSHSERELEEYSFQEYIEGKSFYLLYYFLNNGEIVKYSQINYLQQLNGKSIVLAAPALIHKDYVSLMFEKLITSISFYGFIMIEVRKDKNGNFYMIEANPRLWGPSQLFVDAGVPIFETFLKEYKIIDQILNKRENDRVRYCWSGGINGLFVNKNIDGFFYQGGKKDIEENRDLYNKFDLYRREDTFLIYEMERNQVDHG